ncbi:MAG: zf-HC2 domain-containing protein [Spirochaetes bacterium]|nr:zf-HC2 domain-containing protein [Spirochaetota bacterium]
MKCDRIVDLLPDYLDGLLSPEESEMVKGHLGQCPACREEARFLKKYRKETASFPSLKPPDDFLESIHRRIDAPGRNATIRKLFFPPLIKIPLEAAALAALGITGLLLFRPFEAPVAVYDDSIPSVAAEETSDTSRTGLAKDEDAAPSAAREKAAVSHQRAAPAEHKVAESPALPEGEPAARVTSSGVTEAPGEPAQVTLYLARNSNAGDDFSSRYSYPLKKLKRAEETVMEPDRAGAQKSSATAPSAGVRRDADEIAAIVNSINGRVIRKTCDDRSGSCVQVIVEIPAKSYAGFVEKLRGGWNVRQDAPAPLPGPEQVRIIMHISD